MIGTACAIMFAILSRLWPGDGVLAVGQTTSSNTIVENERVIVWSPGSGPASHTPVDGRRLPGVIVTIASGDVRVVEDVDSVAKRALAGADRAASSRVIVVALKDHRPPALETPPGIASAFPRDGTKQIVENDRVAIWDVRWIAGLKTPLHVHDKDVVAVYLDAGTVRSIPVSGVATATPRAAGDVVFIPRGRAHVEECIEGPRRDIIIELK